MEPERAAAAARARWDVPPDAGARDRAVQPRFAARVRHSFRHARGGHGSRTCSCACGDITARASSTRRSSSCGAPACSRCSGSDPSARRTGVGAATGCAAPDRGHPAARCAADCGCRTRRFDAADAASTLVCDPASGGDRPTDRTRGRRAAACLGRSARSRSATRGSADHAWQRNGASTGAALRPAACVAGSCSRRGGRSLGSCTYHAPRAGRDQIGDRRWSAAERGAGRAGSSAGSGRAGTGCCTASERLLGRLSCRRTRGRRPASNGSRRVDGRGR